MASLWELIARVLARAIYISLFLLVTGALLVLASELIISHRTEAAGCKTGTITASVEYNCVHAPVYLGEMVLREFGIVICSIGLISLLYELIIRTQLIEDYSEKLTEVINPDTRKFGITNLYEDRNDKTLRHKSPGDLINSAHRKILCFGLINHSILAQRNLILEKLNQGCSFQFLLFDPQHEDALEILDDSLSQGPNSLKNLIEVRGRELTGIIKYFRSNGISKEKLEIRTYAIVPTFGAIQVDDERLLIELHGYNKSGLECPGLEIIKKGSQWKGQMIEESDSKLYQFYDRQIADIWNSATALPED
jgi:hypothetical protein